MRTDTLEAAAGRPGESLLDELLTASQLADSLQMRVSTIEEYARRGILPSIKLGRHRRFVRSEVDRAIAGLLEPARARRVAR
jgi:excisionase family DNA binding protein